MQAFDEDPDNYADIIPMTGTYIKDQKMWHVKKNCTPNQPNLPRLNSDVPSGERPLNPQVMSGTIKCMGFGIDPPNLIGVGFSEVCASSSDAIQLKGRAGRFPGASPDVVWFMMCVSLESYCDLLRRD